MDEGDYYVEVRNDYAPKLVLVRNTISLELHNADLIADDSLVLVTLYNSTGGSEWANNSNWLVEDSLIGSWYGVTTNDDGRVVRLELGQ